MSHTQQVPSAVRASQLTRQIPQEWLSLADGLPSQQIHSLVFAQNQLWMATPNGLCVFDGEHVVKLDQASGLLTHGLRTITAAKDQLLVCSDLGLDVVDCGTKRVLNSLNTADFGIGWCQCAVAQPDASYLIGSARGLHRWRASQAAPTPVSPNLAGEPIEDMVTVNGSLVLIFARLSGLWVYRQGEVQPLFPGGRSGIEDIQHISASPFGFLVTTLDAIYQFTADLHLIGKVGQGARRWTAAFQITASYIIGSDAGNLYELAETASGTGIPQPLVEGVAVNDVTFDPFGNVWVATDFTGILKLPALGNFIDCYVSKLRNSYLSVRNTSDHRAVVVGGTTASFYIPISSELPVQEIIALRGYKCWDVINTAAGAVWAATEAGLIALPNLKSASADCYKEKSVGAGRCLYDLGSVMLFGTVSGLFAFYKQHHRFEPVHDEHNKTLSYVYAIAEYSEHYVYVGTLGRGLWLMNTQNFHLLPVLLVEPVANIYSIATNGRRTLVAADNYLVLIDGDDSKIVYRSESAVAAWACAWFDDNLAILGTSQGLVLLDIASGRVVFQLKQFPTRIHWEFTTARSLCQSASGRYWCGTNEALQHINLAALLAAVTAPEPRVVGVESDADVSDVQEVVTVLAPRWLMTIQLSSSWYWSESSIGYQYRVVGLHEQWLPLGAPTIYLCSLPVGRYALEVKVTCDLLQPVAPTTLLVIEVVAPTRLAKWRHSIVNLGANLISSVMHPHWIWRRRQQLLNFERALQLKGAELSSAQASINDLVDRSTQHIYQDRLTGLLNSRGLEQQLADWVEVAMSGDGNVGVLAIEADSFHDYIKFSGQLSAELCHLKISEALQRTLSNESVCVATEQSGYFVVVLNGASLSLAQATAGRVREAINDLQLSNPASTAKKHVTVSIGCFDLVSLVNRLVSIKSYPEMERTRWLANQLLTEAKSYLAVCQQAGGDQVFPKT